MCSNVDFTVILTWVRVHRSYIICWYVNEVKHWVWFNEVMPRCWYFAGQFLSYWKFMLPHLKTLWHITLKISRKAVSPTIEGSITLTEFILQQITKRKIFHISFRRNIIDDFHSYTKRNFISHNYINKN